MSRRRMLLWIAVALLAPPILYLLATLPPAALSVDDAAWRSASPTTVVAGAIHVHTNRSDGAGTMEDVATAAARAGLQFVIFGDHGDATRPPEPAAYRQGVLCLDGVEISTTGGHYLAVDMPAAPYPLAGEPRDVVEDVRRLGGFGIVAHPTSAKRALQWTDWSAPVDGIEWLNADAEWRDETRGTLIRLPFDYLLRPEAALASVLDRPESALARWDALTARRQIVGVAGADAHGRIDLGGDSSGEGRLSPLRIPSYQASFRSFAVRIELDRVLSGNAADDARTIVTGLRRGRVFSAIDALARPVHFDFTATSGPAIARMGETLVSSGIVSLGVRVALPAGSEIALIQDGRIVHAAATAELTHQATVRSAVFRVEVRLSQAPGTPPVPWIVSNPIYVGPRGGEGEQGHQRAAVRETRPLYTDGDTTGWVVERDAGSRAAVSSTPALTGRELAFRYALRGAPVAGQYAALVYRVNGEGSAPGLAGCDRLMFRGRSLRPMRLEVQIRQPGGPDGERWQRSLYLDEQPRDITIFFDDMTLIGHTEQRPLDLSLVDSILLVVDTNHTPPATAGIVWVDEVRLGQP